MGKILVLTHKIYPLNSGDALYNYGLVKAIADYNDVKILSYLDENLDVADNENAMQNQLPSATTSFYHKGEIYDKRLHHKAEYARIFDVDKALYADICKELDTGEYDSMIIIHIVLAQYAELIRKKYPNIKLIYVSQNVETINKKLFDAYEATLKHRNIIRKIARFFLKKYEMHYHKMYEKMLVCDSSAYLSVSKADIDIHKDLYGKLCPSYFAKPLISFPCNKSLEDMSSFNKRLLIIGTMSWFPNVEGAVWFVNEVMPELIKDGYVLYIVGNGPTEEVKNLQIKYPENVIVTGRVDSMDEYFEKSDISIVPLFSGTGVKIKVIESIARGIPTIATGYAAKDYDIENELAIADTADDFIKAIKNIENDSSYRAQLYTSMKHYYDNYMKLDEEIINLLQGEVI